MSIDVKVPAFPESISEGTLASWCKQPGEACDEGDILAEIETDKVVMEVPATCSGVVKATHKREGDTVLSEEVIGVIDDKAIGQEKAAEVASEAIEEASSKSDDKAGEDLASPAVRRLISELGLDLSAVPGTGKHGRVTKQDVETFTKNNASAPATAAPVKSSTPVPALGARTQERVPMTRLRQTVAKRLLDVQQNTAMLTTFNEVDMKPVMDIRKQYKDQFEKNHDTRLGFMSFFLKATVAALKKFPEVNASIDGTDIVYNGFFDISVAVSSPRGLVVPVVRNADQLSFADIEKQIREYAVKAKEGKLTIEEMQGGTFTITNGGTFGSMLSTPIINQPQSAILGMHNIVERPVVINGEIVIRPIMYLALSYDHRIIDGKDSVSFLRTIKEMLEDPARLLIDV